MSPLGKILAQHFEMAAVTKILMRQDKSIAPLLSLGDKHKTLETEKRKRRLQCSDSQSCCLKKNQNVAVTHVQSLTPEVGSGDEGLGSFGFDLSSAEAYFWWLEEEQEEQSKSIWSTWHRPGDSGCRSWRI